MKRKDFLRMMAMCLTLSVAFTACSDDNEAPYPESAIATKGVFVFNSGNQGSSIDGSLSYVDEETGKVTNNLFLLANGRSLGATVQDGVVLGDYLYMTVTESSTIEIVDKYTLQSVKQIQTRGAYSSPRNVVTDGKYVYVSMYSGQVCRIDPETLTIDKTVAVGPNPEEMVISNGALYVTNSDGMNWGAGYVNGQSVSKIELDDLSEKKIAVGLNPTQIGADDAGNVVVLCMGDYGANPSAVWKINSADVATDLGIEATIMTVHEHTIYTINAPWGAPEVVYAAYDSKSGVQTSAKFVSQPVESPTRIAVNPKNGNIYITSNHVVGGYASYSTPGYLAEYDDNGTFIQQYEVGVGANYITFLN